MKSAFITLANAEQAGRLDALVARFADELSPGGECLFCMTEPGGMRRIIETERQETLDLFLDRFGAVPA